MIIDKLSLSLYDLVGYLLPGYLVLMSLAIVDATYGASSVFALDSVETHGIAFAVLAYILGHLVHSIGAMLKEWKPPWFTWYKPRLARSVFLAVRASLAEAYAVDLNPDEKLDTFNVYVMADAYVSSSASTSDREILVAREGFHRNAMVAALILTLALLATLPGGGLVLQIQTGESYVFGIWPTLACIIGSMISALLFRRGFCFYSRLKINYTLLTFLSLYQQKRTEESAHDEK